MKKPFLIFMALTFLSFRVCCQQMRIDNEMMYHLSWDGKSSNLLVDLTYNTGSHDTTSFIYGNVVGGQDEIFKILEKPSVNDSDSLIINSKDRTLLVIHKSKGIKKLHYEINGKLIIDTRRALPNELFRPVIETGSFYIIGRNLFMNTDDNKNKIISVVWDSWPNGMPYFISKDPTAKPNSSISFPYADREDVLIVMDNDLAIKKYEVYGSPYFAVTSKRDTITNMQKEIEPYFSKYFPYTRNFWEDYKSSYYFICMLPLHNIVKSTRTGMNLGRGFTMKYSGSFDLTKKEVIAHETSHTWIGHGLQFNTDGMEFTWFEEGFNDYSAVYNLAGSGMISKEEYLTYLNEYHFKPHYTSPVNTAPADSIAKHFWTDSHYERLSYQRGLIYAFYLDNQIRLASNNKYNIRDFLKLLYKNYNESGKNPLNKEDFLKSISSFLPKDLISNQMQTYLFDGKLIDFTQIKLINEFHINYVDHIPVLTMSKNADLKKIYSWK